ncbi:MAG: hypothetical protein EAX95_13495 [Candidatus Thorarchaeota archaeon]|nr:hypothetical protein [Candidatus Thorarchaeota archaeon]
MTANTDSASDVSAEGIIVEAELDLLRKAAQRALFEFVEVYESASGEMESYRGRVQVGETIVFREDMDLYPAEIVAVKIADGEEDISIWYIISTSNMPPTGYPTAKDAMRAAAAEEKKLEILKDFFAKESDRHKWSEVREWQPDKRFDAGQIRAIIEQATKKWIH